MDQVDFDQMPSTYEPAIRAILAAFRAGEAVILTGQQGTGILGVAERAARFLGPDAIVRAPHHTIGRDGMFGSGRGTEFRAGEITVAEGGLLFLDDAQDFPDRILDEVIRIMKVGEVTEPTGHGWTVLSGAPGALLVSVSFKAKSFDYALGQVSGAMDKRGLPYRIIHLPVYTSVLEYHRSLSDRRCRSTADLLAEK
jgi:hypothetical protein